MSLNAQELADVVVELAARLPGAQVQKINSPEEDSCQITLRGGGSNWILLLDLAPGRTRAHLLESRLPGSPQPPAWIMKLRSELSGASLVDITSDPGDRILRLGFRRGRPPVTRILLAELFGRRGRLLLLDERDHVLVALPGEKESRRKYEPPASIPGATKKHSRFPDPDPDSLAVNRAISTLYLQRLQATTLEDERRLLSRVLVRERKRSAALLSNLQADMEKTEHSGALSRQGEVLKTQLSKAKKGMHSVTLTDFSDPQGSDLTIPLDPSLSPIENMKRLFTKSRRLTRARPKITQRLVQAKERAEQLKDLADQLERADNQTKLGAVKAAFESFNLVSAPRKPRRQKATRQPYRTYRSASGREILVGRSSRDNHQLTFHTARGSDMWFHARNRPGAHVIVRLAKDESIDEQSLLDAATLAAASAEKHPDKVEVTYTRAKNLHPLKGHPGLVSVSKGKTILVQIESKRLARLKKSEKKQ